MKRMLAMAVLGFTVLVGHPDAATVGKAPQIHALAFALEPVAQNSAFAWNGRWQGTTVSGTQLVLQLQVQGERLTGRLTVGKQSAKIVYGKIVGEAFALTTDPIDGHTVDATGRHVDDAIELTIEGTKDPLTLTRLV